MNSRWRIVYRNGSEVWKKKKVHGHKQKDKKAYSYRSRSNHQRSRSSTRLPEWSRKLALVVRRSRRSPSPSLWYRSRTASTDHSPRVRPHKMMVEPRRYDKWDRDRGGGGGSGGGGGGSGAGGAWSSRDRERDRERERQARAHQMSHAHAAEPDASSLFPAPVRVSGHRDKVSQQIQHKLGDYYLAQTFIDDPSKSIGICAEPPSPAPCRESRRESEFKKPAHAPQNGRVHHRPYALNKSDGASSTSAPAHRPPPIRIPNGLQTQNATESSKPPIESILKEMKSLPTPLSGIAATPRKELENKFIFNPYTNKVQENPQLSSNDLKSTLPKAGLDNRIPNSRRSVSPDRVNKDHGLSESDDEVAAATHRIGPPLSPIGSGSPTSGSSSPSDTDTDSSSAGSTAPPPPVVTAPPVAAPLPVTAAPPTAVLEPAQRSSWGLVNFAPPPPQPLDQSYDSGKELRHALADVKGKPQSPISELSDSETSSPSPGSARRRSNTHRTSTASSDDDTPSHHTSSPRVAPAPKRGRPVKTRASEERPAKKRRGRPPKPRGPSPRTRSPPPDSDPDDAPLPPPPQPLQDMKTHIFRKVFTPKKGDEGGGKGGKGGKGKGGKGKGQVTIIEVTAPEPDDDERRRSAERRNEEALARVSPLPQPEPLPRRREVNERIQDRLSIERAEHRRSDDRHDRPPSRDRADRSLEKIPTERTSNDRIATERTSNDRILAMSADRSRDRTPIDRLSVDRAERMAIDRRSNERSSSDRTSDRSSMSDRSMSDRLSVSGHSNDRRSIERVSDKLSLDKLPTEKISHERIAIEKLAHERLEKLSHDRLESKHTIGRLPDTKTLIDRHADSKITIDRLADTKISIDMVQDKMIDRLVESKMTIDRIPDNKLSIDKLSIGRLTDNKMTIEQLSESKMAIDRLDSKLPLGDRYVRAEADVGSGLKPGRGSERMEDPTSIAGGRRSRVMVRLPLARLRPATLRALQRPRRAPPPPPAVSAPHQSGDVAPTNHERTGACSGQTPIYYSYFERLPADALSDEERDHKYYLEEATRLRTSADREQEPLTRVMLYLESVLCFVLTGRVLELELDTKGAFTIYRETIEYIKLIHSMPQRYRASPHDTFNKLDILSLRVQSLLYLRMFKMYNREVKEYNKIVHEYQQKPACAESASPLSPTPSPAGSVGSVGSGASASSGYCSLVHSVPAHAHQALLLLTKYYMFLYVAHDLWEQADGLCRLRANQDLFIAVDRKCGPLSLSSTFRHLVQYVRHAITLLKSAPRE